MPTAALRPCVPGCPTLVASGERYCPAHKPTEALGWRQDVTRIRGRKLTALRQALWDRERGCCQSCGRVNTLAKSIRDHIVPLAEGTIDQPNNDGCQLLCIECSNIKTQQEAQRGRRR